MLFAKVTKLRLRQSFNIGVAYERLKQLPASCQGAQIYSVR